MKIAQFWGEISGCCRVGCSQGSEGLSKQTPFPCSRVSYMFMSLVPGQVIGKFSISPTIVALGNLLILICHVITYGQILHHRCHSRVGLPKAEDLLLCGLSLVSKTFHQRKLLVQVINFCDPHRHLMETCWMNTSLVY